MKSSIVAASLCILLISAISPASAQPIFGGPPVFTDPGLQQCLEETATAQGWTDTAQVVQLTCPALQITSTQGIEVLSSLAELDLTDNTLADITGLDLLAGLTKLTLSGNAGIPLPALLPVLGQNTGLTKLGLGDIDIGDLYLLPLYNGDPQVNAPYALVELDVGNTGIGNIDRLVEFPNLRRLDASGNGLPDVIGQDPQSPVLGQLTQLRVLDLSDNALVDLPGADLLTGLTELTLSGNAGIPLPALLPVLGQNTGLTRLGLADIDIDDLYLLPLYNGDPQVNAPYALVELDVGNTGIDNINRLVEFPGLTGLDVSGNGLSDVLGPDPQSPVLGQLTQLRVLDLSDNALVDLPGADLLTGLTELTLSGNAGIPLPALLPVLGQNTGLTRLGLGDIDIGDLFLLPLYNGDPQVNAPYALVELDVGNTGIDNIDRLVEFPNLRRLDASGNGLSDVLGPDPQSPVLGQLTQLRVLDLSDNALVDLPGADLLTGLTELTLSGNAGIPLPALLPVLGQNTGLTRLGLADIDIDDLYLLPLYNGDPQVNAPYALVELDVGNTGIGNIDRLVEFPGLARLDVSGNGLQDVIGLDPQSPVLGQLPQLTALDASDNRLRDLPGLELLTGLTELTLSGNAGIPLPALLPVLGQNTGLTHLGLGDIDIGDLFLLPLYNSDPQVNAPYALVELDVGNTGIDNIDRLVEFPNLRRLDVSGNGLPDVHGPDPQNPVLGQLTQLRVLDLSDNRLTDIPGLNVLSGLTELTLTGNAGIPLPALLPVLGQNTGLTRLGLGDIDIGDLYLLPLYNGDPQVNAPYALVELDVGNTGIGSIDRLVEFPGLTHLDLGNNQLSEITGPDPQNPVLGQLSQLRVLDLSDNRLTDIPGLNVLSGLTELTLSGNAGISLPALLPVLGQNTGLTRLGLGDIDIGDLYLLPLYNGDPQVNAPYALVELDVGNTGIDNIDRLVEFSNLARLDVSGNGLQDVIGLDPQNPVLEQLTQLRVLDLSDNALVDLPGADLLTGLTELTLSGNAGIPLPALLPVLGQNTGLTHLGLGDITIDDLFLLPLYNGDPQVNAPYALVELDVGNTGIDNIDRLVEFSNLARLDVSGNGLQDVIGLDPQNPVLEQLTQLRVLDLSDNALVDLPGVEMLTGLTELNVSGNAGILLPVVNFVLANNSGLTHLGLGDIAIGDLFSLALFNYDPQVNAPYGLVELDVGNTGISNINRLVEFPGLTHLDLGNNLLSDITGPDPLNPVLRPLQQLTVLDLSNNSLDDLPGLDLVTGLTRLTLSGNAGIPLPEVQAILGNNPGLTHLGLADIAIGDLYNLPLFDPSAGGYYRLVELDVGNTGISKLNHLSDFPELTRLNVSDNQIADLAGGDPQNPVLHNLLELTYMDVSGNQLTDLAGLDLHTGLVELYLSDNAGIPLPVVQPILANNTGLTHLGLGDIVIGDLFLLPLYNSDPQVNAPYKLVELDVSNTGISNIDRLVEFTDLTILDLGNNLLADITGPDPQNPVLVQLTQLRELKLNNNFLTDVNGLDTMVWLDTLDLSGNGGISCDDLAHLDAVLITTMISHPAICVSADGDINEDGVVNIVDVLMGTRALLDAIPLSGSQLAHADVAPLVGGVPASDGMFTAGDLVVLQRKVLGIINF